MTKLLLKLGMLLGCMAIHAAKVNYTLSMPQPHTHYFEVEMTVEDAPADYVDLKMPVWAPGSYLVREFSRNVEGITASGNSSALKVEKLTKNTWRVHAKKAKSFTVKYKVYAFELSVRTSFVDASHGYVNGTSVFLFVDQKLDASGSLKVVPFKDWKTISTGLPAGAGFGEYTYANYDQLVDCPIEIGNHSEFEFTAAGVKHRVAMYGEGNYDVAKLKTDMAKIIQACTDVFGFNPNKEYVFIIHNLEVGSGGLEHSNSTTLQVDRWTYEGRAYIGFLSLVAHEYFHLWNVKRIRPRELGPFDYENEVYTSLLWIMEGFTSYYDELLLLRAGFYTPEQYMKKIASSITSIENQPGNRVLPLSEASMDAWIKLYRPNENSYNTTISYYTKGAVVAAMLDMKIIRATKGKKRLDDVLVYLYDTYYTKAKRGFTEAEAQKAFEEIAGESFEAFFNQYINGTEPLPYEDIASGIGITVERYKAADDSPYLGVRTAGSGGKLTVQMVVRNTSAYNSGLNVNDEIIAVNGFRVDQDQMDAIVDAHKAGDTLEFLIARGGLVMPLKVVLEPDPTREFVLQMGSKGMQDPLIAKWLGK